MDVDALRVDRKLRRGIPGRGDIAGAAHHCLQSFDGGRLPQVRFGAIGLAKAHPAEVGQIDLRGIGPP